MNCKNCQIKLEGEKNFCANCGAKAINSRLNFKAVSEEFFETFISWDNKFIKTFIHLFTKPQIVANGYLEGIRKRYMKPFAYIIIALTLYGVYSYYGKDQVKEYMEHIVQTMQPQKTEKEDVTKFQQEYNKRLFEVITNYFNLFTFMMIPLLASINLLIFRKKNNFIEHNVLLLYSYGHYMFTFVLFSFVSLIFSIPLKYIYPYTIVFMIGYHIYFYKKIYNLTFLKIILKTILFWLILIIAPTILIIVFTIIFFALKKTGIF